MQLRLRYCYTLLATLAISSSCIQAQQRSQGISWRGILRHPAEWYGSEEAIRVADNVLLYQHENGGCAKNIEMAQILDESEKTNVVEESKTARTTIDNGATMT